MAHETIRGLGHDILGGWISLRFENFSIFPLLLRETCISFCNLSLPSYLFCHLFVLIIIALSNT